MQRNAHTAVSNDEKASRYELGRGHGHKRNPAAPNPLAGYSIGLPTVNTYARSACVISQSADGRRRASSGCRLGHVLLLAVGAYLCLGLRLFAQTPDSISIENNSWTATTDWEIKHANPTRIVENHIQNGNRTLDKQSVQFWIDGSFQSNEDIERETLQLDANTVRITTRKFGRDGNGRKTLAQVTEEEKNDLPGGVSSIVRLTSSSDLNGALQPIRREVVETQSIGYGAEEVKTTVLLLSIYGSLDPAIKKHELRKRFTNNTIESKQTTLLLDGAGNWQATEVRQVTTSQDGTNRTTEQRVSQLDYAGKLADVSRVLSRESESTSGEKRSLVETYSIDVPGTTRDGSLHVVERKTGTEHSSSTGERATDQRIEQTNPGDPGSGPRVSVLVDGRMVPVPSGFQATRTVRFRDLNGNFEVVEVDTTKSDKILTVQFQQTPAEKP